MDSLIHRRDRKRRNQRIAAGVVGIAVFVTAVWIVTSVGSLDRSETPAVPGPAETGPPAAASDVEWNGVGLPPEGVVPSTPVEGELVARFEKIHVGYVFVYADGRVIWKVGLNDPISEQRLTPEGVDLVRSGAVRPRVFLEGWYEVPEGLPELPVGAWADSKIREYVPARYAACFQTNDVRTVDPAAVLDRLPAAARAIFQGKEQTYEQEESPSGLTHIHPTNCFEVTSAEALAVAETLSQAGSERSEVGADLYGQGEAWAMRVHSNGSGEPIILAFRKLLPHGMWVFWAG